MQIEEIDRHHPSTLTLGELAAEPLQMTKVEKVASRGTTTAGLGLDIGSLGLSETGVTTDSPITDVPPPRGAGPQRQFSRGNRAFEEQALAVSWQLFPKQAS
jgi:hypothetical protein